MYVDAGLGDEVAVVVHVEHALEEVGVGPVADGHEQPGDRQASVTSPVLTLRTTAPSSLRVADQVLDDGEFHRNSIFGLANARSCMIFDARSASRRWIRVTLAANLVRNVASSMARVAAADDGDLLAAEEEAVAGGARRQAVAEQPALGLEAEHQALGAGRHDDGVGGVLSVADADA